MHSRGMSLNFMSSDLVMFLENIKQEYTLSDFMPTFFCVCMSLHFLFKKYAQLHHNEHHCNDFSVGAALAFPRDVFQPFPNNVKVPKGNVITVDHDRNLFSTKNPRKYSLDRFWTL